MGTCYRHVASHRLGVITLVTLFLLILSPVAVSSLYTISRTLRAESVNSLTLYGNEANTILWQGMVDNIYGDDGSTDHIVTLSPSFSLLPVSFYSPGLPLFNSSLAPSPIQTYLPAPVTNNRTSNMLAQVTPSVWSSTLYATKPLRSYLSSHGFSCRPSLPSLAFADRRVTCQADDGTFEVTYQTTLPGDSQGVLYPMAMTMTYTSLTDVPLSAVVESDGLTILFHLFSRSLASDVELAAIEHSNMKRRDRARVAVGFLWTFAALVMFFLLLIAATFQSWLLPIFPFPFALYIWIIMLLSLTLGISIGTGIAGFIVLLILYAAYSCIVAIGYYIHRLRSRETPSLGSGVGAGNGTNEDGNGARGRGNGESLALLEKSNKSPATTTLQQPITTPRNTVLMPSAINIDPMNDPIPVITAPTLVEPLDDNDDDDAHNPPHLPAPPTSHHLPPRNSSMRVAPRNYDSMLDGGGEDGTHPTEQYARSPNQMGYVQRRFLGFSGMFFLTCFVLCVALFGIWRVNDYRITDRMNSLPAQPSVVEYIPQTIAKSVESVYAFDNYATKLHLDNVFFSIASEWCGVHYTAYLEPGEERRKAIQVNYIEKYKIDMSLFLPDDYNAYPSVNEWFIRSINPLYRPIANSSDAITSPADARVTLWSNNPDGVKFWIKGDGFTMEEFLSPYGNPEHYIGGTLVLLRLAPQDYHNFHIPLDSTLKTIFRLEGTLHSVNADAMTSRNYAIYNQRTVMIFNSPLVGDYAFVAIGALCVGSVRIPDPLDNSREASPGTFYAKGSRLGYFQFGGSTIALVFRQGTVRLEDDIIFASQRKVESLVQVNARVGVVINKEIGINADLIPT